MSLAVGLFASLIVLVIGLFYGSISGYFGGKVDMAMMRIVDIIYSLPDTLMVVLLSVVMNQVLGNALKGSIVSKIGPNMISLFVVFGVLYWVGMARLVRGQILSIKNNEYVLAARAMGAKPGRIIRKHILPNCMSVIIIVPMFYPYSYEQMITVNGKRDKTAKNLAPFTFPRPSSPRASCRSSVWACRRRCPPWARWPTRPAAACRATPTRWCSPPSSSA